MLESLTKIYCSSDLKQKRTPTVYQNVSEYNNQENNTAMTVSPSKIYCPTDLKQKRTPTIYQNATQYNNQEYNTAITVLPAKIYCLSDLKQKRRHTVYRNVTQYNNKQKHSHDSVTNSNMLQNEHKYYSSLSENKRQKLYVYFSRYQLICIILMQLFNIPGCDWTML